MAPPDGTLVLGNIPNTVTEAAENLLIARYMRWRPFTWGIHQEIQQSGIGCADKEEKESERKEDLLKVACPSAEYKRFRENAECARPVNE